MVEEKVKTKQHLPVGVVWDKVATVLDAGLTVEKSNKAFNDRQEMFNFFVSGFGMLLRQTIHSKPVIITIIIVTFVMIIIIIFNELPN